MSSTAQKRAIREFKSVSGATDKVASDILAAHRWDLESSLDYFFTNRHRYGASASPTKKVDVAKITAIFDEYADSSSSSSASGSSDIMRDESMLAYFEAIGVDPASSVTLELAWVLQSKSFGMFRRQEFVTGWEKVQCDTTAKMKAYAAQLHTQLQSDRRKFKEFYRWLFEYSKEEPDRKTIDPEMAYDMWSTVLSGQFELVDEWIEFCKKQNIKTVPKDVWEQLYEFSKEVSPDLSDYDADGGAWPLLFDEFVEAHNKQDKR